MITRGTAVLFLAWVASFGAHDALAATRIHVRGQARLDAQTARDAGDTILSGLLVDDAGQALADQLVAVSIAREATKQPVVLDGEGSARPCAEGLRVTDGIHVDGTGGVSLVTDEAGRFCVRLSVPREDYLVSLSWGGTQLVDGTKIEVPVDGGRQPITLRFDPEPQLVSLEKPTLPLQIAASYQENQTTHAGANLPLYVTNERGDPLGGGITNAAGILHITIPEERLGPPGRGEIHVSFAGNDELAKSRHRAAIERHARVHLEATAPPDAVSPEDGIPLAVLATARGGAVPSGSVEARLGDVIVGAAPLEHGKATLSATFGLPREPDVELRLRFLADAPWFEPGDDAVVRVPVKGRSLFRQAPLGLSGLAVLVWLVVGRMKRAPIRRSNRTLPPKPTTEGGARVEVVRETRDTRAGWSGRVIDAHDGTPVKMARIHVERPGFERAQVMASCFANEAGHFELRAESGDGFDELVIEGPLHAELRQPLPPCGELEIALVLRKRRLLERLAMWARRRGRPWDASPEATPGHVRRVARGDFGTARWADAVERAAYGGGEVDGRLEAEIDRLAPDPAKPPAAPNLTVRDFPESPPESD